MKIFFPILDEILFDVLIDVISCCSHFSYALTKYFELSKNFKHRLQIYIESCLLKITCNFFENIMIFIQH